MRAGRLRHRLTVQTRTDTRDSTGAVTSTWTDARTVWAAIDPLRGEERFNAGQVKPVIDTKVTLRGHIVVNPKMRFVDQLDGQIYDIDSAIKLNNRQIMTEVFCKLAA